jgi:hypothetical protein
VPSEVTMGGPATITFRITNTATPSSGTCTDKIYQVRFSIAGTRSTFRVASTVPPIGWTSTASSTTTRQYFWANSWADSIPPGASRDFAFVINAGTTTTDVTETLTAVRARWTNQTTAFPAPPSAPTQTGSVSCTSAACKGTWMLKALSMTLVPAPTNIGSGCQFTLTMSVTNKSTTNGLTITSLTKPPTRAYTGSGTAVANTASTPADLTLKSGVTGTMVWTYTLTGQPGDTVNFTACASTGATCNSTSGATRTSSSVTTGPVTIVAGAACNLVSAMTNTPICLYSGSVASFQMMVTNTTGTAVTVVKPVVTACTGPAVIGAPACTFATGPTPTTIWSLANGATGTFTWTAAVTGNPNDSYSVSGYATANGPITTATVTSNPQDVDGYVVTVVSTNTGTVTTNAESQNEELDWTIYNYACSNINQVSIAIPAGWTFANEGYALVTNTTGTQQVETWNPPAGTTFTSPNATDRIPPGGLTGSFFLVFSQTPVATGNYNFNVTITDDVGVVRVLPSSVTVNSFNTGGWNATGTGIWQETIQ